MSDTEPQHELIGTIEDEDTFLRITVSMNRQGETLIALTLGDIDARRREHVLALKKGQFVELKALLGKAQAALVRLGDRENGLLDDAVDSG